MRRSVRRSIKNVRQRVGRTLRKARSKRRTRGKSRGRKSRGRKSRGRKSRGRKSAVKQLTETLSLPKELSETLSSLLQGPKKSVKGKRPVIQMESSSEPVKNKSKTKKKSKKSKKPKSWHAKIHGKKKKKKKKKKKMKGGDQGVHLLTGGPNGTLTPLSEFTTYLSPKGEDKFFVHNRDNKAYMPDWPAGHSDPSEGARLSQSVGVLKRKKDNLQIEFYNGNVETVSPATRGG